MCGLIAMIPKHTYGFYSKHQDIFRQLLVLDGEFRGLDSTGVFQVQKNRQVFFAKSATVPQIFLNTSQYDKFKARMLNSSTLVVGHNRKATFGAKTSANSHPFNEGKITLVHNGTLFNHKSLAETEVDSHAIAHALNSEDADEVIKKLQGAFALIWYDAEKEKLFAVRNKERPLSLVETNDMWYLASEAWMVKAICSRHNDDTKLTEIEPGQLYSIDPFSHKVTMEEISLVEPVRHRHYTDEEFSDIPFVKKANIIGEAVKKAETQDCSISSFRPDKPSTDVISSEVLNDTFRQGDHVLVRINQLHRIPGTGNQVRVNGTTVSPGLPIVDVAGEMWGVTMDQFPKYFDNMCEATVSYGRVTTNGGPCLVVNKIRLAPIVRTWNNVEIPFAEWEYIVGNCKCKDCNSEIELSNPEITIVKRLEIGLNARYEVICCDCIDYTKDQNENSNSAVQERKQVSQPSSSGSRAIVVAKGPDTVQ